MENRYIINYDIKQKCVTVVKFKQGDIDSSALEIHLFDDGKIIDITGETIEFRFLKPDNTIVFQDSTTGVSILDGVNGKVECTLKSNTISSVGSVRTEITRKKNGLILTCPAFNFIVESSIGGIFLSSNYITSIESKLIEWQQDETLRQTTFNNNEGVRQTTFNNNEGVRQITFNNTQQDKSNTFNASELNRLNLFNSDETSRQNNETDRQNRFNLLTTAQQQVSEVVDSRTSTIKSKTFSSLDLRLEAIETDIPKITDTTTNKKYTFTIQVNSGKPQLIYTEVI